VRVTNTRPSISATAARRVSPDGQVGVEFGGERPVSGSLRVLPPLPATSRSSVDAEYRVTYPDIRWGLYSEHVGGRAARPG
jgi:hypothetical protein